MFYVSGINKPFPGLASDSLRDFENFSGLVVSGSMSSNDFREAADRIEAFISFMRENRITWWKGFLLGFDGEDLPGYSNYHTVKSVVSCQCYFFTRKAFDPMVDKSIPEFISQDIKENNALYLTLS
jgi:hypothetical protein